MNPGDGHTVAIWRHRWLAPSETFITDQIDALTRWKALTLGRTQLSGGLRRADVAPFGASVIDRARFRFVGPRAGLRQYRRAIARSGATVFHAHFATEGGTAGPLAHALGLPLIITCHGYDVTAHLAGSAQHRRERALAEGFARAERVIAVSEFIAERAVALGAPEDRVVVHHIGIRTDAPGPVSTDRRGVLFVGRLVAKKGVDDLLRAYAALPQEVRSAHPLTVVGDGPEHDRMRVLARSLHIPVELAGWQSPEGVRRHLRQAAVFCVPSRTAPDGDAEGFGLVFLEASLAGLPCVSYRHGGVPEAVIDGETGVLAEEGDVIGLTRALQSVLTNPGRAAELGARGEARVRGEFDIRTQTAQLERIYDEVAGGSRGGKSQP